MVTTRYGGMLLGGRMRLLLLPAMLVIGATARVVVLVATEITPGAAAGIVIVTGKGRKCSWFEVKLRRLSGDGILLLRLSCRLLRTAGTVGRLLQMRLRQSCRLLLLLQMLLLLVVMGVRMLLLLLLLLLVKPSSDRTPMVVVGMINAV